MILGEVAAILTAGVALRGPTRRSLSFHFFHRSNGTVINSHVQLKCTPMHKSKCYSTATGSTRKLNNAVVHTHKNRKIMTQFVMFNSRRYFVKSSRCENAWSLRTLTFTTSSELWTEKPGGVHLRVKYVDTGADWDNERKMNTPTVLATHGAPGSHEDVLPLLEPLANKHNFRVLAVNFPGFGWTKGVSEEDDEFFAHTNTEREEFLLQFINDIHLSRIDILLGHSAGTFPLPFLCSKLPIVKSAALISSPHIHRVDRITRPYWIARMLYDWWESGSKWKRVVVKNMMILPYKLHGYKAIDWQTMVNSMRVPLGVNQEAIISYIFEMSFQQIPVLHVYSANDRYFYIDLCQDWASKFGVEGENFDVYDENLQLTKKGVLPANHYAKGVEFAKAGHYPMKKEGSRDIILKEILALYEYAAAQKPRKAEF